MSNKEQAMPVNKTKSILLVEDDDSLRLALRDYLLNAGYHVQVASDGVGAIKLMLDSPEDKAADLIVTDYRMAVFGGDYWVRFLETYCKNIKVIVTSGYLQPDFPIPYRVIFKPFEFGDMARAIASELNE